MESEPKQPLGPANSMVEELLAASPGSRRWMKLMIGLQKVAPALGLEMLRTSLDSRDRRICAGAQQVLIALGHDAAIAMLASSLQSADSVGVSAAARLLAKSQARSAIPALIACLDTRGAELDSTAKRAIARAMGLMPHRDEIPPLAKLLRGPSRRTRAAAAGAMAQIRAPESEAALRSAANDLSWFRGRAVRRALSMARDRGTDE